MRRREFIICFGGAAAGWPVVLSAQTRDRLRRIGYLTTSREGDAEGEKRLAVLRLKLRELGWTEGRNLQVFVRYAYNSDEQLRQAATEMITTAPDAIVSTTSTSTRALMNATTSIPIVAAITGDPIGLGFTKDLSHPTGNVTGFSTFNDTLAAKRLGMLREIVPAMRTVALMWVPANPQQVLLETQTKAAAQGHGVELLSLPLKSADDIAPALATAQGQHASAIIVAADPLTTANGRAIIDGCVSLKMPAMHTFPFEAKNGALVSYGIDGADNFRRSAEYVDRILKGAKIADLPFQEPTRLTLSVNLRTARAIGITVPPTLVALADEVIE